LARFDPKRNTWSHGPALPWLRAASAAASVNGGFFVLGRLRPDTTFVHDLSVLESSFSNPTGTRFDHGKRSILAAARTSCGTGWRPLDQGVASVGSIHGGTKHKILWLERVRERW